MRTKQNSTYKRILAEVEKEVRIHPRYADLRNQLALLLMVEGERKKAESHFLEALRLNPNNPLAHFNLGWALEQKADYPSALQEYRRAAELDPQNANYRLAADRVAKQVPL